MASETSLIHQKGYSGTCRIMMNSLKELYSKVINENVAQERAEFETEINTLVGLSWDALYLKTHQERNKNASTSPFHFTRVLQSREIGFSRPTTRIYSGESKKHYQNMPISMVSCHTHHFIVITKDNGPVWDLGIYLI